MQSENSAKTGIIAALLAEGACYIHGTSSLALPGVARYRALLALAEIDATPWFHRAAMTWGEREDRVEPISGLPRAAPSISQGVSLTRVNSNPSEMFNSLYYYTQQGWGPGHYPVVFALDGAVPLQGGYAAHALSDRGIGIQHILSIYVPPNLVHHAQTMLVPTPVAAAKVKAWPRYPFDVFGEPSGAPASGS